MQTKICMQDKYTALHIAVEACQPLVIQTLLGYGAQVELKGGQAKETPLHIASRIAGAEQCVEMLIKCGADVNNFKEVSNQVSADPYFICFTFDKAGHDSWHKLLGSLGISSIGLLSILRKLIHTIV